MVAISYLILFSNKRGVQELISQDKIRLHDLEPIRTIQWDILPIFFSGCVFLRYVLASNDNWFAYGQEVWPIHMDDHPVQPSVEKT